MQVNLGLGAIMAGKEKILVFIPMYNCERQIGRVIAQFTPEIAAWVDEVIILDNGSSDNSLTVAKSALEANRILKISLLTNNENYGLGGSQKAGFGYAIRHGYDYVIMLHGDDQGSIAEIIPYLEAGRHRTADCLLGSRFMPGSRLDGYSWVRIFGNYVFNTLFAIVARRRLSDLGSGLNLYSVKKLAADQGYWMRNANNLTFNYFMILVTVARGWRLAFFPISWREDDQVSNVKLFRQSFQTVKIALDFFLGRKRFLETDHVSQHPAHPYTSTVFASNEQA